MIELYFNDANLLSESREEEQYAEAALNNVLTGKTADTGMCILPCFYDAPLHKGLLYNLDDGTTLQIRPILNEEGKPELLIRCVTEESVETVYQRGSNYDFDESCAGIAGDPDVAQYIIDTGGQIGSNHFDTIPITYI